MDNIKTYVTECYADMDMVDFLIDMIPDYENVLLRRHLKYVDAYLRYNRNIKMVATYFNFSQDDIRRIFWRIQRKLLLEFIDRAGKDEVKVVEVPENFDSFLLWQLEQFRDDARAVYAYVKGKIFRTFDIDGVSENRRSQIEEVLTVLNGIPDLDNVLPEHVYHIAKDLLDGMALTDVAKKHNKNFNYLVTTIIGRKNPRSRSERGWLAYLQDTEEQQLESKVIQFPLR